jgi:hypothetical protein
MGDAVQPTALAAEPGMVDLKVDSGRSHHIIDSEGAGQFLRSAVTNARACAARVRTGGGLCAATHMVDLRLLVKIAAGVLLVTLTNALFKLVPGFGDCLLSVSSIEAAGGGLHLAGAGNRYISMGDQRVDVALGIDRLYHVAVTAAPGGTPADFGESNVTVTALAANTGNAVVRWHRILGHRNYSDVLRLSHMEGTGVIIPAGAVAEHCAVCTVARQTRTVRPTRPTAPIGEYHDGPFGLLTAITRWACRRRWRATP